MIRSKAITLLLLLVFCGFIFSYISFFISIKGQKSVFRQQVLQKSPGDLSLVDMENAKLFKSGSGIEWKENNREIVINGKYFEVVAIQKGETRSRIFLIEDNKENELFAKYFSEREKNDNNFLQLLVSLILVYDEPDAMFCPYGLNGSEIDFVPYSCKIPRGHPTRLFQPPAVFS